MASSSWSDSQIAKFARSFGSLARDLGETDPVNRVQPVLARYRQGLFRLVVVGEAKAGKSSFVNALLGAADLIPTPEAATISTVFRIAHGKRRKYEIPAGQDDPSGSPEPAEITVEQAATYASEGRDVEGREIDLIAVETPHPALARGLVVIDTPGLDELFHERQTAAWRYLPDADAVFLVLDSMEPLAGEDRIESLERLSSWTPHLFYVQTKIDLVSPAHWQACRDQNLETLADRLRVSAGELVYFPVANTFKHAADRRGSAKQLQRSGFQPVIDFLNHRLLRDKRLLQADRVVSAIHAETDGIRRRLIDRLEVQEALSQQRLGALDEELDQAEEKFERWALTEHPKRVATFEKRQRALERAAVEALQSALDPSPAGGIVDRILDRHEGNAQQLKAEANDMKSECVLLCGEQAFAIQDRYNRDMQKLVDETLTAVGHSSPIRVEDRSTTGTPAPPPGTLEMHLGTFESLRMTLSGGMMGSIVSGFAVKAVAAAAFPPAAAAIGVVEVIGGAAGALWAKADLAAKRRERARQQLRILLSDTVRQAQRGAIRHFGEASEALVHAAKKALIDLLADTRAELETLRKAINQARRNTQEENQEQADSLRATIARAETLLSSIAAGPDAAPPPAIR